MKDKLNDETMKELTGETDREFNERCRKMDKKRETGKRPGK